MHFLFKYCNKNNNNNKHMDELKRPTIQYSTLGVSNDEDSTKVSGGALLAPNSGISASLAKQASREK